MKVINRFGFHLRIYGKDSWFLFRQTHVASWVRAPKDGRPRFTLTIGKLSVEWY